MSDDKLARIRKLLAQAEDRAATAAEAEAFTAKAAELMARHGVDAALLAAADPGREVVGDLTVELLAPYAYEKASLGAAVARGLRCSAVLRRTRSSGSTSCSLHLFGATTDLVLAELLLTSLMVQGTAELTRRPVPPGEHPAAYRRTWWLGFAGAIGRRLREAEEAAAHEAETKFAAAGTSAALVLADRAALADHAASEAYPRLRIASPRYLSGGGAAAGHAAGERADLGRTSGVAGSGRGGWGEDRAESRSTGSAFGDDERVTLPVLTSDCGSCFGLCCVLLPFSREAGFGATKPGGTPCDHLGPRTRAGSTRRCARTAGRAAPSSSASGPVSRSRRSPTAASRGASTTTSARWRPC